MVVVSHSPTESQAEGVKHPGANNVVLLKTDDLAARLGIDHYRVEAVGSVVRGDVP